MNIKQFEAITVRETIVPGQRRVLLQPAGAGLFLVVKSESNEGKLVSTWPFTIFIREEDFCLTNTKQQPPKVTEENTMVRKLRLTR